MSTFRRKKKNLYLEPDSRWYTVKAKPKQLNTGYEGSSSFIQKNMRMDQNPYPNKCI